MNEVHVMARKRNNGQTVYQYRFEIAKIDGERKWISKSGFKTKAEAKKAGNLALQQYENVGHVIEPADLSFSDFLDSWIENDCKVDLKQLTVENYQKKIRLYIKPYLGSFRLKSIQKDNLQKLLVDLYNTGLAKNTLSVIKGILTKSMDYAVDNHYLQYSPASRLKLPKNQTPDTPTRYDPHVYITKDRIKEIFERFPEGTSNHIPLMFGYKCGLRIAEAFAICWEDIDLDNKTLSVNKQIQWHQDKQRTQKDKKESNGSSKCGNGYWFFTPPKYNSYRTIDLDDELVELLRRTKKKQEKAKTYYDEHYICYYVNQFHKIGTDKADGKQVNFVCVRESGEYINLRTMQYTSSIIHHKMNYPEFDFHSLRHTHATMLSENGVPIKYIQNRLGHKKIEVTMNVYQHYTNNIGEQGADILNRMY